MNSNFDEVLIVLILFRLVQGLEIIVKLVENDGIKVKKNLENGNFLNLVNSW